MRVERQVDGLIWKRLNEYLIALILAEMRSDADDQRDSPLSVGAIKVGEGVGALPRNVLALPS